jgi:cytochrome P450
MTRMGVQTAAGVFERRALKGQKREPVYSVKNGHRRATSCRGCEDGERGSLGRERMSSELRKIPHGPAEKYNTSDDLLVWMEEQFKRYGDIFRASAYGMDVYVVSDPEYVDHVLRVNWQNYTKGFAIKRIGFLLGNGLMVSEGEFWKSQRRMVQPAFHEEAIGAMVDMIRDANVGLLEKWTGAAQRNESVNITTDISQMVLETVLRSLFGEDHDEVAADFAILSDESARNLQFAQMFRPLGKRVVEVAARRRSENRIGADILGMLMQVEDRKSGQPMTDRQLVSEVMTLIVAGHETTASTLAWTWYLLAENPEAERKLSLEVEALSSVVPDMRGLPQFEYVRRVIEETLRLYPAGWLMTRKALKDDQLGDYFVPAGAEVYISPYLLQRHPALWEAPERFDPDRFERAQTLDRHPMTMIPFSAGPRKCIGEIFARVEMQMHVAMIAKKLRLRGVSGQQIELEAGVNLRNKHDFIMTPELV